MNNIKKCLNCGSEMKKYNKRFCSKECKNDYYRGKSLEDIHGKEKAKIIKESIGNSVREEKNPNYGNKWTDEQKTINGNKRKELYEKNPSLRIKVGSANRGKKFSEEIRQRMSEAKQGKEGTPHTDDTKILIGLKSKEKWTEEYKEAHRKTMIERGYWIPDEEKDPYFSYRKEANWIEKMFNYITSEEQLSLLKEVGVFNSLNNSNGVVRDHMYSRRSGFENNISPLILRHPCNCQLITNSDNLKKKKNNIIDGDSITIEELIDKIINYSGLFWKEHEECLILIKEQYV